MWSIVSSMKLLRKPSKRGEGDIERNKGSTASLKDHSKESSISHLDGDVQVNLDPSCSTESGPGGNGTGIGKSATLGSTGGSGSGSSNSSNGTTKVKVERRESARLASSATKFLRSLRNHSGSGKIVASSVIAADDKHPINVIALKELDIETHSLNPGAASTTGGLSSSSRGGAGSSNSSATGKLPERSQSFNEKRLLVVTQNTSSENNSCSGGKSGNSGQVKVKHSRAQSFVCNNSSGKGRSAYSIYLNHHQHQHQSAQQNNANIVKQQNFGHKHQKSTAGTTSSSSKSKGDVAGKLKNSSEVNNSSTSSTSSRANSLQSCETIYENLEVILEEKQIKEHMKNKSNIPSGKDNNLASVGAHSLGNVPTASIRTTVTSDSKGAEAVLNDRTVERCGETSENNLKVNKTTSSSSESLENNMRISGKERPSPKTRIYNKDSGYETSCSDYSNIPKSCSVDSMINPRSGMDQSYSNSPGVGIPEPKTKSNRILNTSLYEELNISPIGDGASATLGKSQNNGGNTPSIGGGRKLRRSISEVPAERCTNLAKLQTKVGDSTARAMYTIANGLTVWTTEKCSSSLGLNGGNNSGQTTQTLQQYQNIYGCRPTSQIFQSHSNAPVPGGFSAAIQQASVYSTLPRNHHSSSSSSSTRDAFAGYHTNFQYQNVQPIVSSPHHISQAYHHYHQITAKSTPSVRNAVLQEHQVQTKNCFGEPNIVDDKQLSSSSSSTTGTTVHTGSEAQLHQQHSIYQTIPVPTLSPARSTPNLGSTGNNKQLHARSIQQGSIPHLPTVSSSHQQVNDLGKNYPKTNSHNSPHQNLYNQQSLSSSVVQLQQLKSTNDNTFAEPGRYPSTPNLQNNAGFTETQYQCSLSENHSVVDGNNCRNTTGSTNNSSNSNSGAMSSSNDSVGQGTPNNIGGNWNSVDVQSILNNNNSAPARDPSSLKQIRYGPGHEKYPSWPIPVSSAQQIDPAGESHPVKLVPGSGSTRSKSWTEQTDYPKEKTPSYARPYMKRVNHSYTQQLKTVMEKCERIPPEAYSSHKDSQQFSHQSGNQLLHHPHGGLGKTNEGAIVPPPLLYRDLMCSQQNGHGMTGYPPHHPNLHSYYHPGQQPHGGNVSGGMSDKDYMITSPERIIPEKENTVSKPLTQEDLELYTKKYEELIAQYPQSEGYHSYISSDSSSYISSGTPFLDQLRRESENNQQFWTDDKSANNPNGTGNSVCDPNDPLFGLVGGQLGTAAVSGRESVTTVVTNSSSNSSGTETLKWHGSTSDISLASGVGGNMHSGANTGLTSSMKQNTHSINSVRKGDKGWGDPTGIVHSSRLSTPQKQHSATAESNSPNGISNLRSQLEYQNGSSPLGKWQSGISEIGDPHPTNNKHNNSISNNISNNCNSNQPNLKKFPLNTYTRPNTLSVDKSNSSQGSSSSSNHSGSSSSATSTPEKMAKLLQSLNTDTVNAKNLKGAKSLSHSLSSPVIDTSKPPSVAERILELEQQSHQQQQQSGTSPSTSGTSSPKMGHPNQNHHSNEHLAFLASSFMKSSSLNNLPNSPTNLYPEESHNQSQVQNDWAQGNKSNTMSSPRGFMQSLSTSTVNKVAGESNSNNVNNTYSYLDPDKKHKVADMTLKAIQKKALLSYYERHKGKCANTSSASSVSSSDGNSSQPDGLSLEKDLCFPGKSNRLMLSLPKEHAGTYVDQHLPGQGGNLSEGVSRRETVSSSGSSSGNSTLSTSPSLTGLRGYRSKSTSSSGVSSSSSSSSRSSNASHCKVSSQSQQHQQFVHGAVSHSSLPKPLQSSILTAGLPEDPFLQVEKSEGKLTTAPNSSSTPEGESTADIFQGSESARLAYMSKYLPHLVNRDSNTPSSPSWSGGSGAKLPQGGVASNTNVSTITQEPAPTPPERPPKKPHLRNLAQQVHEESKDTKPPPPLPRAPVRPPAILNNGTGGTASTTSGSGPPPPIPSKPVISSQTGGIGITRSPSPDELPPPPPPPPTEEMEVLINDEPLPPPPTVTEVDVIFGSRSRSVTGLSSCLHKDSYMAQRKERTLGYEGRYRRTLSPSGLGSNNSSKSSLDSASPGGSDSVGRGAANLGTGKLDSSMSPAAWEKFHNIRPPSTTVIFTSNELAKGASSPPSSSSPSTSGSPQPPTSQAQFHRSISCDSNIFNNKTGVSQSTIPPPVAQVAPLRGTSTSSICDIEEPEKISHGNMFSQSAKSCDNDGCSPDAGDNLKGMMGFDFEKVDEKAFLKTERKVGDEFKSESVARSISFSNSVLPSVIVPPLQYEKYDKDGRSVGLSLNPNYSSESNLSALKKSEVSLRVNCTSVVELQSEMIKGRDFEGLSRSKGPSPISSSSVDSSSDGYVHSKGSNISSAPQNSNSTASFYTGRQKTQEELECEELSRDIAKLLPQGDKLQTLLVPLPDHKTTADYMEGLFHLELKLQPETSERRGSQSNGTGISSDKVAQEGLPEPVNGNDATTKLSGSVYELPSPNNKTVGGVAPVEIGKQQSNGAILSRLNGHDNEQNSQHRNDSNGISSPSHAQPVKDCKPNAIGVDSNDKMQPNKAMQASYRRCNGHAPLPADSAYFTTSESKAKFLTQYNKDIKKEPISGSTDGEELDKQKEELVSRISRKLEILRTEQHLLREEIQSNEQLGQMVVERVQQTAKRNEFDKFKLHVEEIEKITSLLLGISGRLARAENALMGLSDPPNPQEKKILESKRDKLREQLDEAKILKENIDRRSAQVSSFLQKYLTAEEYADYDHFVKMKAKLIIDAREIDDKIKLGEEQLGALKDALNTTLPFSPNTSSSS